MAFLPDAIHYKAPLLTERLSFDAFPAEGELSSIWHPAQLTLSKYTEAPLFS